MYLYLKVQHSELQLGVRQHLPQGRPGICTEVAVRKVQLLERRVCPQPPAQRRGALAPEGRVVVQLERQEGLVAPDAEGLPQCRGAVIRCVRGCVRLRLRYATPNRCFMPRKPREMSML